MTLHNAAAYFQGTGIGISGGIAAHTVYPDLAPFVLALAVVLIFAGYAVEKMEQRSK